MDELSEPPFDRMITAAMHRKAAIEECRIWAFLERTNLPIDQVFLAVMPSGNGYPQWIGAKPDERNQRSI